MQTVDEKPETIHLYVVREEEPKPSLLPIFMSAVALSILVVASALTPYQQPVTRLTIRVSAVLLPLKTFTTKVAIIPTGVRVYPATTAHGVLTITNGSVISQTIPQGFRLGNVITDIGVFVPAGSANGYGYTTVSAHALLNGKQGNVPAYTINQVEGSSVYIRNLVAFRGDHDSYSVKYVTSQDRQLAISKSRYLLTLSISTLHYPCSEQVSGAVTVTWHCQFVSYRLPSYMHVIAVRLSGRDVLVDVAFIPRPQRMWVK